MDLVELRNKQNTNRHPWEFARFNVLHHFLTKMIGNKTNPVILDIGCGDSFVLESVAQLYPNGIFIGVDSAFTKEDLDYYAGRMKTYNSRFYTSIAAIPQTIQADIILLMDVIEHIEFDIQFLQEVKQSDFCTDNTKVFITVPAFQGLFCSHDTFLGHYRRYTNQLLLDHTKQGGFNSVKVGYFFWSLLIPRYLQVMKERNQQLTSQTTGLVEWNGSRFKTNFITTILTLDFKLGLFFRNIGISLPGLSNYIICKKTV